MARFFDSSRILWNNGASDLTEREQVQETPTRHREETCEPPVEGQQRLRVSPDVAREHRHGGKDAAPANEYEPRSLCQLDVLGDRAITGMLEFRSGANQPALKEKVH